jgi:hypothetical protein
MNLVYTHSSDSAKGAAINEYNGIGAYFEKIEAEILEYPFDSVCEKIITSDGRILKAYKKTVMTDIFSGRFPNSYLYLSLSYAASQDNDTLVVLGVYIRTYSP